MNKEELQAKIAKMEQGLENPNISGPARVALKNSITSAKTKLTKLKETDKSPKEVYVSIDKAPEDGQYDVNIVSMDQAEWEKIAKANKGKAPQALLDTSGVVFVGSFPSKPKAIAAARAYCEEHKLNALNNIGKEEPSPKSKKRTTPQKAPVKPAYSWRTQVPTDSLQPITLHCQHYHLEVQEDTKVSLKRTGKTSVVVTAKKGDHIIFDDKGYAVFIMEPASFARKCTEKRSVAAHQQAEHKPEEQPKAQKTPATKQPKAKPKPKAGTPKKRAKPRKKRAAKRSTPSAYRKAIQAFDQQIDTVRKKYQQAEVDKEGLATLSAKSTQQNYVDYVARKIKRLEDDGVRITQEEIIRIGIAIRPMVQSLRGTLADTQTSNRQVLKPTLDNLIRWSKDPGRYDLIGVDTSPEREPTVTAKVKPEERKSWWERFLEDVVV